MRVYIPSIDRPGNVPVMEAQRGDAELVWLTDESQADAYRAAGAKHVVLSPPGKPATLNAILDAHPDEWCVFSDDDCRKLTMLTERGSLVTVTLGVAAAAYVAVGVARRDHGVFLPSQTNTRFASRRVSDWASINSAFFAVAPNTECRFDETMTLGEDIDFACRVFDRYGRVARPGWLIGDYRVGGPDSHFRAQHLDPTKPAYRMLIARYPHLLGWKNGEVLQFKRIAPTRALGSASTPRRRAAS